MIKIDRDYRAKAIISEDMQSTWDRERYKLFKVSIFGLTLYRRTENLNIEYENMISKKVGFNPGNGK